ncbi:hypothetical protein T11_575 [Trichinella zimbabwensis]|uniref:Uncharacterized protein n=1 Tax=Trichinella zimbabwensis TaxID=268475 RepID=A0A0V1GHX6_9BILA|nr:hypothetical protein T11_575 [Trichinella zimbabwensis]
MKIIQISFIFEEISKQRRKSDWQQQILTWSFFKEFEEISKQR